MAKKKSSSDSLSTSSPADSSLTASPEASTPGRRAARAGTRATTARRAMNGVAVHPPRSAATVGSAKAAGGRKTSGSPSRDGAPKQSHEGGRRAVRSSSSRGERRRGNPNVVTDDDIRTRAYFLYLEHGPQGGSELDYWIRAERELRRR